MELEDLKKTWKSVEPHIEKASTGTSDIPDLESKTDYKTRLLRRCIISLTISVVSFPLVVTSRLWAPMVFPISWLVSFGIVGIIAIMAEIYLINMIRKVSISEFSISEIMKATLKIKKYYKNIELIFSVVFAILMGWLVFLPPFLGNWRMVLVLIAIVITSIIELRLYNKNITLINRLSGSEYSDIN